MNEWETICNDYNINYMNENIMTQNEKKKRKEMKFDKLKFHGHFYYTFLRFN